MSPDANESSGAASKTWVWLFGSYLIVLNLVLLYLLIRLWPGQVPLKAEHVVVRLIPGVFQPDLWTEPRFLSLVAVAGALGSYVHLATSFADYLGNRQFRKSWSWWYILRPFIGSSLALIIYFAVRGGLVAGTTGAADLSPYGVTALAGLAGMFSKDASDKMKEVFENLFKTDKPPRADPLKLPPGDPKEPGS